MRAVLDTNVLVSGLLKPHGNERPVLALALRRKFVALVSEPIWTEYEAVLRRPELKLQAAEVDQTLAELRKVADRISPTRAVTASPDESDNRFLECAVTGGADYLVTGNKRHFPARHGRTLIVNARELIQLFAPGLQRG
jgi:putative PIN family toxin of toxin-antitoxin system